MIDARHHATFAERGLIRLDGLIPDATVAPARSIVREALHKAGVWRDGTWLLDEPADMRMSVQLLRKLKPRLRSPEFKDLLTPDVLEAASALAGGRNMITKPSYPQVLFTPPNATAWTVPHKVWHLDVPRLGDFGMLGVQMFTFLEPVAPGAGGTLMVAGSHRLLNDDGRISSKDVKRRLKREPYFRDLFSPGQSSRRHFLDEAGHVGDVELRVVELHGEPGDVVLTDLRMLHTLAPKASRNPRWMVTQRFFVETAYAAILASTPSRERA